MRLCWLLLLAAAWLHALVRGFAFGSGKSDSGWARSKAPRLPQLHLLQSRRKPVLQEHAIRTQPFVSLPVLQAAPSSSSSAASKGGKRAAPKLQNQSSKVVAKKAPRQSESDDVVADPAAMRDWMAEAGIDLQRAEKLYNELKGSDDTVEYDAYLNHKIVQQLMQDGTLNADLVKKFWSRYGGGKQLTPLSHQSFMEMQINLDVEVATRSGGKGRAVFEGLLGDDDPVMDELAERFVEDPYNKQFDPKAYFDADTVEFLTAEFSRLSGGKTALSFDQLKKWDRLQEVCANNSISLDVVRTMWEEATQVSGLGSSDKITLNTFLRWNVRLEGVITMVRPLTPEAAAQIQAQYERAFARLTGNQTLATFEQLLKWPEVQDILKQELLTTDELRAIFDEIAEKSSLDSEERKLDVYGFMELEQRLSEMFTPEIDYTGDAGEYVHEGEDEYEEGADEYDDEEDGADEYDDGDDGDIEKEEYEDADGSPADFEDGYYDIDGDDYDYDYDEDDDDDEEKEDAEAED